LARGVQQAAVLKGVSVDVHNDVLHERPYLGEQTKHQSRRGSTPRANPERVAR
jgi:hypothetical protein